MQPISASLHLLASLALAAPLAAVEKLPDLVTVVPTQVQLVNKQQKEILRFTNAMVNLGDANLQFHPDAALSENGTQDALQDIFDEHGNVVRSVKVSTFAYHPEHNHWHIANVAHFSVRRGSPTGPQFGQASIKVTFCLIDWWKMLDNSPSNERTYFDCSRTSPFQGISVGWADQYHQSTVGQQLDITGIPAADDWYLVSVSNPEQVFIEKSYTNNTAWAKFSITSVSTGNKKLTVTGRSTDQPGLNGENIPNR